MPISIVVPQLGESVAEGTVSKWLKKVGEKVRKEEPLVEIQTDKINVEIPSPAEGVLQSISVAEGTTVLVGTEIGVLAAAGEPVDAAAKPASAAAAPAKSDVAATVAQSGRPAAAPAPARAQEGAMPARAGAFPAIATTESGGDGSNGGAGDAIAERNLSPAVRKLMRENNVRLEELGRIQGSGVAGRVTRDDLIDYLKSRTALPH